MSPAHLICHRVLCEAQLRCRLVSLQAQSVTPKGPQLGDISANTHGVYPYAPASDSVPVHPHALASDSLPVHPGAPASSSVPVHPRAPASDSIPVHPHAPASDSVPVCLRAPASDSVPALEEMPVCRGEWGWKPVAGASHPRGDVGAPVHHHTPTQALNTLLKTRKVRETVTDPRRLRRQED